MAKGHELPMGGNCLQSGAFSDTILRNVAVCALTSSRLHDFPI